ncbi:MAG: NUDIX hydrolase [Eubacterium sp.]|jgi:ADP-ribose pyrophosphatase
MTFEEKTLDSEMIYRGKILNLRRDKVTVLHGTSYREIVEHHGGSVIVAVKDDGNVITVKQYRKPAGRVMLEIPAGKRDPGETPEETARRELKEETGYSAKEFIPLTKIYPSPGYTEEVLYIFLALGLESGETHFDDNEAIDICEYPLDTLAEMALHGKIEDAKSIVAVLLAKHHLESNKK